VKLIAARKVDPVVADSLTGCGLAESEPVRTLDRFGSVLSFDGEANRPDIDRIGVKRKAVVVGTPGNPRRQLASFGEMGVGRICIASTRSGKARLQVKLSVHGERGLALGSQLVLDVSACHD
jgi:hypothetical protein